MYVSVKQSKEKSKIFNDRRYRLQWPHVLLSDSTLTCFVVIKGIQLAMAGVRLSLGRKKKIKISPQTPLVPFPQVI